MNNNLLYMMADGLGMTLEVIEPSTIIANATARTTEGMAYEMTTVGSFSCNDQQAGILFHVKNDLYMLACAIDKNTESGLGIFIIDVSKLPFIPTAMNPGFDMDATVSKVRDIFAPGVVQCFFKRKGLPWKDAKFNG